MSADAAALTTTRNPLRRLYGWVLGWAEHPMGLWALAALSFAESIFFPIPPDVLLIGLCLGRPKRWLRYATVCSLASVAGGIGGYLLGLWLLEPVCLPLIEGLGLQGEFARASLWYREYDVWAVGAAGFSPIPYKVFTISAGITRIDFPAFLLASALSRSARFFLVAGLLYLFGDRARTFVDTHLNRLALLLVVLGVGGFVAVAHFGGTSGPTVDLERAEVLIAELESADVEVRARANLELLRSTGHYVAFLPEAPPEERSRAVGRWREWLETARRDDPSNLR